MFRFGKPKQKEIWEETPAASMGDIEAAKMIRNICNSAATSAESFAGFFSRPDVRKKKHDAERYDHAKKRALEVAKSMSDELLRDMAVRQIINLCLKANDVETASVLIRAIETEKIREEVLKEYPALR